MKRFKDYAKEFKFADWTTKEILETDDYWRFYTGTLNSIQQSLIRLLEGYSMDSCECENLVGCMRSLQHYDYSDERLGRVFQDTFRQFCVIGSPEDPNEDTFQNQYKTTFDSKSFRLITDEEKRHLKELLKEGGQL